MDQLNIISTPEASPEEHTGESNNKPRVGGLEHVSSGVSEVLGGTPGAKASGPGKEEEEEKKQIVLATPSTIGAKIADVVGEHTSTPPQSMQQVIDQSADELAQVLSDWKGVTPAQIEQDIQKRRKVILGWLVADREKKMRGDKAA